MKNSRFKKLSRTLEMDNFVPIILLVLLSCVDLSLQVKVSESDECRFPGAPAHSSISFSNDTLAAGTVATYSCERGFELLGPARRVCDRSGQWMPEGIPFCVLNVAAGKAPMQVSSEYGGTPQKAIDGSTSSFFNKETCTLTQPERVPWWYVNLLEPYMVQLVRLDFGKSCCGKNKPATIVVRVGNNRPDLGTNPICNRFTGYLEEGKPLFLPCNPPMPGAFVSVHLETPAGNHQLSICEAFVYTDQALPIERCPQFRDQPPGSTATYNGKCYIFYNQRPLNLRDALAFCRSRGGSLVDESNPALQGFISWELWRRHRGAANAQYWMGAIRDQSDRTNWKWLSGEDVTVSFWNLPGGNEDCARYDGANGWLWSDTNCNAPINFICQHQPKNCGRPEQPPNSTMLADNFNVGSLVEYACDEGHLLVGPPSRVCLPTGFYNEFPPVCKRIQCGLPADISNGGFTLINGTVGYLSEVMYFCDEGYKISGRPHLTCDLDERWDGPPPRCQVIRCPDPPSIPNGEILLSSNATVAGTVVEYTCSSRRYRLVGPKQIVCLPNGHYDSKPPICKEEIRSPAAPVVVPTLVTRAPSSSVGSTVLYKPLATPPAPPREKPRPFTSRPPAVRPNIITASDPPPHIVVAGGSGHPHDNEIPDSVHARNDLSGANVPSNILEEDRIRDPYIGGAKLNLGAIIALGVFGGFVFLAAVVTTIVILIRRNRSAKHYRHRPSPDCHTVASYDSSSSESHGGLNRYYRQAWENLHQSTRSKMSHAPLRRKEEQMMRDGSELQVSDITQGPGGNGYKKRHHHHHHHHAHASRTRY